MANRKVKKKGKKRVKLDHMPYSKDLQFKSVQDKAGDPLAALKGKN